MSVRKLLFWSHLIVACCAGIVIFVLSLTGVLLAFERQINDRSDSRVKVTPPSAEATPLSLEQLTDKFGNTATITVRARPLAPVEFAFGRERRLLIDGYTGEKLSPPSSGTREFFSSTEKIHRALGGALRNSVGRSIVGASNLLFLFLVVSGLYLWFPKQWTAKYLRPALWFRGGLSGRSRDWNWHNTIGFWCSIPLFFIVLSGVIMSYQWANNLLYQMTGTQPPAATGPGGRPGSGPPQGERRKSRSTVGEPLQGKPLAELIAGLKREVPDWNNISFPAPKPQDKTLIFSVDTGTGGQPQKRWQQTVDRTTGSTVHREGFEDLNAGRKLRTIARFLHTGEILGLPGQIIAALASTGALLLVWTGFALAFRRYQAWTKRNRRCAMEEVSAPATAAL